SFDSRGSLRSKMNFAAAGGGERGGNRSHLVESCPIEIHCVRKPGELGCRPQCSQRNRDGYLVVVDRKSRGPAAMLSAPGAVRARERRRAIRPRKIERARRVRRIEI